MSLTQAQARRLDEDGYLVLDGLLSADLLARLRERVGQLFAQEGAAAGAEFKQEPGCRRLANLVDKGDVFREVIAHPQVLGYVRQVLGPDLKLSSLNARAADPGGGAQPLHADMGAVADARGYWVCNTVWLLDDYTPDNGALRLVPGSHRWGRLPQEALATRNEERATRAVLATATRTTAPAPPTATGRGTRRERPPGMPPHEGIDG